MYATSGFTGGDGRVHERYPFGLISNTYHVETINTLHGLQITVIKVTAYGGFFLSTEL